MIPVVVDREVPRFADTLPQLSVVLPCYRAATLARRSVEALAAYLDRTSLRWEVIVVDDGGGDFGAEPLSDDPRARLLRLPVNRGKGAAVTQGMLAARGLTRFFTDVDLPYDLHLLPAAAEYLLSRNYHMVVGDRTLPTSSYESEIGWERRFASRCFSMFVGTMVTGGFFDTQCGFKGVRGDVAELLFRMSRLERFAFDVELVYLGLHHRLDIKRIPVQLRNNETSSVRVLRDSVQMLMDVLRIKRLQLQGAYRSDLLARIVVADFELALARNLAVAAPAARAALPAAFDVERPISSEQQPARPPSRSLVPLVPVLPDESSVPLST
jgi:dolichyl-phosphate beta-glucosyltransferase